MLAVASQLPPIGQNRRSFENKSLFKSQLSISPAHPTNIMLTEEQIQEFNDKGFLALPGFSSQEEISKLQSSGLALLETFDPESISIFSTRNQTKKTDQYFLDSANEVSFFFEEGAFDEDGKLKQQPKALSINKIGHGKNIRLSFIELLCISVNPL